MDKLFNLPAHPLLVHIPVVLLPLAAVGVVLMMVRPGWHHSLRWSTVVVAVAGTIGAILSAASGEELEDALRAKEGADFGREIHEHAEAGELARNMAILFLIVLLVYVLVPWFKARAKRGSTHTAIAGTDTEFGATWLTWTVRLVLLAATVAVVWTIIAAGHTGAWAHWHDALTPEG